MLQPAYNQLFEKSELFEHTSALDIIDEYPNARKITTDTFFLGTSPVITPAQLDYIEETITNYFKKT
jgi:dTDP-4-amino-4,6-dideoxygalactose transaminase